MLFYQNNCYFHWKCISAYKYLLIFIYLCYTVYYIVNIYLLCVHVYLFTLCLCTLSVSLLDKTFFVHQGTAGA